MCQKRNTLRLMIKGKKIRVDACMRNLLRILNLHGIRTVGSCCGHGKYNMSIVVKSYGINGKIYDLISDITIPREIMFYKKDKEGYYYIPEVVKND